MRRSRPVRRLRKGKEAVTPLYTVTGRVSGIKTQFVCHVYAHENFEICDGVTICLLPCCRGHILGSALVNVIAAKNGKETESSSIRAILGQL